jgi:hypothetical protein
MLDALMRRVNVMTDRGADAFHLVGGNRGTDAGTANHDAARDFARCDLLCHGARDIGKIHRLVVMGADVDDLVAKASDMVDDGLLQRPAGVVGSYDETHENSFSIFLSIFIAMVFLVFLGP